MIFNGQIAKMGEREEEEDKRKTHKYKADVDHVDGKREREKCDLTQAAKNK